MKSIEVVAAVIKRNNKIFATQRGYGEFKGLWEFPGGKIEKGEDINTAIKREIKEELNAIVNPLENLCTIEYDYPTFHITMHCILCELISEELTLLEHDDAMWLDKNSIDSVKWLEADIKAVEKVKALI